ncbi:hypothetical protein ABG067_007683 [Albugo candida]
MILKVLEEEGIQLKPADVQQDEDEEAITDNDDFDNNDTHTEEAPPAKRARTTQSRAEKLAVKLEEQVKPALRNLNEFFKTTKAEHVSPVVVKIDNVPFGELANDLLKKSQSSAEYGNVYSALLAVYFELSCSTKNIKNKAIAMAININNAELTDSEIGASMRRIQRFRKMGEMWLKMIKEFGVFVLLFSFPGNLNQVTDREFEAMLALMKQLQLRIELEKHGYYKAIPVGDELAYFGNLIQNYSIDELFK